MSASTAEIGDAIGPIEVRVSNDQVSRYATLVGSLGRRFHDDEVARREGLPGRILPGNMSMALLCRLVRSHFPGATLLTLGVTFRGVVLPEMPLRASGFVTDVRLEAGRTIVECDLVLECQGERRVTATAVLESTLD